MFAGICCWISSWLRFIAHSMLEAHIKDWKKTCAPNAVRISDQYYIKHTKTAPPGISVSWKQTNFDCTGCFVSPTSYWANFWWDGKSSSPDCAASPLLHFYKGWKLRYLQKQSSRDFSIPGPQILPSVLVNRLKCEDLCLTAPHTPSPVG